MLGKFAEFYAEGGIWMHFVLLAGLSGIVTVVLQFVKLRAKWNAFHLTLGVFAGLVVFGLLGTVLGLIEAFTAVAAAPPDMKEELIVQALAISLNTCASSLMFLGLLIPPASIAAFIRSAPLPYRPESDAPSLPTSRA
jgi:hypothetical protein